jgi:hypothetical protein
MAIIKFKQLKGFYNDDEKFHHELFTIDGFQCVGECLIKSDCKK